MTIEEIETFLKRVTYKDGHKLRVRVSHPLFDLTPGIQILLDITTKDSDPDAKKDLEFDERYRSHQPKDWSLVNISGGNFYTENEFSLWTERDLASEIKFIIQHFETHDMKEWLRIDAKPLDEPHPERYSDSRTWRPREET